MNATKKEQVREFLTSTYSPQSVRSIADTLHMPASSVRRILGELKAKGLVRANTFPGFETVWTSSVVVANPTPSVDVGLGRADDADFGESDGPHPLDEGDDFDDRLELSALDFDDVALVDTEE